MSDPLVIRECTSVGEFDECTRLQREAFNLPDLEISPRRHLIVARKTGGWILGAFLGGRLVGFVLHLIALRHREVIGYSHMMAISVAHQNRGIGARLKWAQRQRALSEGINLITWTWDPMQARNAHFNLNRLGVVVRSMAANFYGTDYASAGGGIGLDSDRLFADWHLNSDRTMMLARGGEARFFSTPTATIETVTDWPVLVSSDSAAACREQLRVRAEFAEAFGAGLVCAGFERNAPRPRYLLFPESEVVSRAAQEAPR